MQRVITPFSIAKLAQMLMFWNCQEDDVCSAQNIFALRPLVLWNWPKGSCMAIRWMCARSVQNIYAGDHGFKRYRWLATVLSEWWKLSWILSNRKRMWAQLNSKRRPTVWPYSPIHEPANRSKPWSAGVFLRQEGRFGEREASLIRTSQPGDAREHQTCGEWTERLLLGFQLLERPLAQAFGTRMASKKHLARLLTRALRRSREHRHMQQASITGHFRRLRCKQEDLIDFFFSQRSQRRWKGLRPRLGRRRGRRRPHGEIK